MRDWASAIAGFLRRGVKPAGRAFNVVSAITGLGFVGIVAWAKTGHTGLGIATVVLSYVVLVLLVAGVRLQHATADKTRLRIERQDGPFPEGWRLDFIVHNDGPTGGFVASILPGVIGLPDDRDAVHYEGLRLRWSSTAEDECQIHQDRHQRLHVCTVHTSYDTFAFAQSEGRAHPYGYAFTLTGEVAFSVEVRDQERDGYRVERVVVTMRPDHTVTAKTEAEK